MAAGNGPVFKDSAVTLSTGTRQMSLHPVDAVGTCSINSHLPPKTNKSPHVDTKSEWQLRILSEMLATTADEVKRKQKRMGALTLRATTAPA